MSRKSIDNCIRWIVENTPYTMYQIMRVAELTAKYDDKVKYHLSKKQKKIFKLLEELVK